MIHPDQNCPRLAAIRYRAGDRVDELLRDVTQSARERGTVVGGVVQLAKCGEFCCRRDLLVQDLATGKILKISQDLGKNAESCVLDPSALARAGQSVQRAIVDQVDLLVTNRFGGQEALGHGFRQELISACEANISVLTAVNERYVADWITFTGSFGIVLRPERSVVMSWMATAVPRTGAGSARHLAFM